MIKNNTTVYARRKAKKNKTKYSTKTINKIIRKVKKCKIKEVDDKWKLIEYLNEKGLDLTNYKAGGYDDLRYSALIGLFNASHIITGTAVKQYHAGPDGTINPVYNDDGRIVGQNNTDGMSYQVPVMETKTD